MKKRVVFLITIILISISILMISNKIQATEKTLSCGMETEEAEIKQGEETSITLKVNSEEQINVFQAKINYDENIWEEIDESNFETKEGWESLKYNKDNKEFNVINKQDKTNKEILKIKLKAKDNANIENTEITIDGIVASDGNIEFKNEKLTQKILIKEKPAEKNDEENKIETPSNSENKNNSNGNDLELEKKLKEKLPSILPKTGKGWVLLISIIVFAILSIIFYSKYKKCGKTLMMLIICGILISQSTVFAASEIFLGDVNQSSVIDDEDIEIMQEYLIKLKDVTSLEQADMNSDSKLSIIDLSLLIKQQKECPYDKNNVTNITSWSAVPIVSKELLQKQGVTTGGEGCQWPIGMAISKDGKLLLYGTDVGGVYRSEDGGQNWEQSNAGLQSRGVGAFSIDPKNPSYVVAVGINSSPFNTNGLYISEDGGKSWKFTKMMLVKGHRDVREAIAYDESSYNQEKNRCMVAYWSTAYETEDNYLEESEKGLYKTTDGGYTWNLVNNDLSDGTIKINPYTGDVYVSRKDGIYYSLDKGENFEKIVDDSVTGFDLTSQKDQKINVYYCNNDGVYISKDGKTFDKIASTSYPTTQPMNIKVSPINSNKMLLIDRQGTYQNYPYYSIDGGKTIVDTGMYFTKENINVGIESSYQSPTNPKVLFACDLRSEDGGHTWTKMDGCINVYTHNPKGQKELYGMDETGKYVVTSYDNGKTWEKVNNTEFIPNPKYASVHIMDVAYDWKNEVAYVACEGGYLYKTSTKDGSVECVLNRYVDEYKRAPVNLKGGYSISKVAVDPIDPNIIYCGGAGNTFLNDCALYRSVDGGKSFQVITSNTTNSIVKQGRQGGFETNSLEVNPKTGELLFAGGCFGISKLSPPYKLDNK